MSGMKINRVGQGQTRQPFFEENKDEGGDNSTSSLRAIQTNIASLLESLEDTSDTDVYTKREMDDIQYNTKNIMNRFRDNVSDMEYGLKGILLDFERGSLSTEDLAEILEAENQKDMYAAEAADEISKDLKLIFKAINTQFMNLRQGKSFSIDCMEDFVQAMDKSMERVNNIKKITAIPTHQSSLSLNTIANQKLNERQSSEESGYFTKLLEEIHRAQESNIQRPPRDTSPTSEMMTFMSMDSVDESSLPLATSTDVIDASANENEQRKLRAQASFRLESSFLTRPPTLVKAFYGNAEETFRKHEKEKFNRNKEELRQSIRIRAQGNVTSLAFSIKINPYAMSNLARSSMSSVTPMSLSLDIPTIPEFAFDGQHSDSMLQIDGSGQQPSTPINGNIDQISSLPSSSSKSIKKGIRRSTEVKTPDKSKKGQKGSIGLGNEEMIAHELVMEAGEKMKIRLIELSEKETLLDIMKQDLKRQTQDISDKTISLQKKEQSLKLLEIVTLRRTQDLETEIAARIQEAVEEERRALESRERGRAVGTQTEPSEGHPDDASTTVHKRHVTFSPRPEEVEKPKPIVKPPMKQKLVVEKPLIDMRGLLRIGWTITSFLPAQTPPPTVHPATATSTSTTASEEVLAALTATETVSKGDVWTTPLRDTSNKKSFEFSDSNSVGEFDIVDSKEIFGNVPTPKVLTPKRWMSRGSSRCTDPDSLSVSSGYSLTEGGGHSMSKRGRKMASHETIVIHPIQTVDKGTTCHIMVGSLDDSDDDDDLVQEAAPVATAATLRAHLTPAKLLLGDNPLMLIYEAYSSALTDVLRCRLLSVAAGDFVDGTPTTLSRLFAPLLVEIEALKGKVLEGEIRFESCREFFHSLSLFENTPYAVSAEYSSERISRDIGILCTISTTLQMLLAEYRAIFDHVNASDIAKLPKLLQSCVDYQRSHQAFQECQGRVFTLVTQLESFRTKFKKHTPSVPERLPPDTKVLLTEVDRLRNECDTVQKLNKQHIADYKDLERELFESEQEHDRTPGALLFFAALKDDGAISSMQQLILQVNKLKSFVDGSEHVDFAVLRKRIQVCINCVPSIHKFLSRFASLHYKWTQDRVKIFLDRKRSGGDADSAMICPLCSTDSRHVVIQNSNSGNSGSSSNPQRPSTSSGADRSRGAVSESSPQSRPTTTRENFPSRPSTRDSSYSSGRSSRGDGGGGGLGGGWGSGGGGQTRTTPKIITGRASIALPLSSCTSSKLIHTKTTTAVSSLSPSDRSAAAASTGTTSTGSRKGSFNFPSESAPVLPYLGFHGKNT
eukprot:gene1252-2426_t